jgi:hypothetical protein
MLKFTEKIGLWSRSRRRHNLFPERVGGGKSYCGSGSAKVNFSWKNVKINNQYCILYLK